MELYQELLLTTALSILIAFLLAKIVSVASAGDDLDPRDSAERAVVAADLGLHRAKAAATGGEVKVVGGILRESNEEGRGTAEARGYDRIETDVGRKRVEIVSLEEEELVVEGGVVRCEEVRASELGPEKVEDGDKRSDANGERLEGNLVEEMPEKAEIGRICLSLVAEEEGSSKDEDDEVNIVGSLDEEKEVLENVLENLETKEVGVGLVKEEEKLAEVEVGEVNDVLLLDTGAVNKVGLESETGGLEKNGNDEKVGTSFIEDDDWEGIERSELEKFFGSATAFVGSADGGAALSKLSNDLQMQLYGFHKVATEGPCYESQPLALMVSARAKWHAWQRLGSMNPEVAMEQYISLLSDNIPGWMIEKLRVDNKQGEGGDFPDAGISGSGTLVLSSLPQDQLIQETQRKLENHSFIEGGDKTGVPKDFEQGLPVTDFLPADILEFLTGNWGDLPRA